MNSWGLGGGGELGLGGYYGIYGQLIPSIVPFPPGIHAWKMGVSGGGFYGHWTLAIADDDQLYGTGNIGMAPHDFFSPDEYFSRIIDPEGTGWKRIAAGDEGWLALTRNGHLYGWLSSAGPIHYPPPPDNSRWAEVAVASQILSIAENGRLYTADPLHAYPAPALTEVARPAGSTGWTNAFAGTAFCLALADNGELYGWGFNGAGELGIGSSQIRTTNTPQLITRPAGATAWKAISCGSRHTLALMSNGELYAWGCNNRGQIGVGHTRSEFAPVKVPGLTNVTAVATGREQSLAVADGKVWTWGRNTSGELGTGFTSAFWPSPVRPVFNYDISAANSSLLPIISITAPDSLASVATWLSTLGTPHTNTARFQISRSISASTNLDVHYRIEGTASNGVDYAELSGGVTIPAGTNCVSVMILPTQDRLLPGPSTIQVRLLSTPDYMLGNSTNVTIQLIQYEDEPGQTLPYPVFHLFVGLQYDGQPFSVQASTNLQDWAQIAVATNTHGVVSYAETNWISHTRRFFRALPLPGKR